MCRASNKIARLGDMGAQPVELLANVAAGDQHRQFLRHPLLRHGRREAGELAQERLEPRPDRRRLRRRTTGGRLHQGGQLGALRRQHRRQPRAFLAPRGDQAVERQGPAVNDRRAPRLDDAFRLVLDRLDDAAQANQAIEPRRRRLDVAGQFAEEGRRSAPASRG